MEGGGGAPPAVLEENESRCVPAASCGADGSKRSSWGFLFTGIVGGTLVAVYAVATPFLTPALRKICLPFVPATTKQIENVVKMLHCRTGSLVDIGSGDGRIVIAAAKAGFRAVGYELNPWLVWYSRYRAWREGVQDSAQFYISDLWKVTFSQYSNIIVFGVPQMVRGMVQRGPCFPPLSARQCSVLLLALGSAVLGRLAAGTATEVPERAYPQHGRTSTERRLREYLWHEKILPKGERAQADRVEGRVRGRSRLPVEQGARCGTRSQDAGIMT
ncbi:ATP synthase subunit C lysine N-methyltransferase isoform X3 [Mustela lutreola]|uniref:ATP synthase subunit C lysine N-methyltransferase isoform X3 n=1 Tax=Mustela lutreola TaxID=9666 RepID=UPI002796EAFD|nr:ATP synthase subunit C lysine N-methyltransferase isoform X3 [Mustela lutreola]